MLNNKYVYIEKLSQKGNYNTVDKEEKKQTKKKEREKKCSLKTNKQIYNK